MSKVPSPKKYIIMCSVSGVRPTYENKGSTTVYWGAAEIYESWKDANKMLRRLSRSKDPRHRQTDWNSYHGVEYRKGLEHAVERLNEAGVHRHPVRWDWRFL
jgi:hypothetical protein